jgi:hypothetical protein
MAQTITISDFKLGERRDANLIVERLQSLRTIRNYRLQYSGDGAKLKVRKGYTRWNSTELDNPATQLFWFNDLTGKEHLLGIADDKWVKIAESGAHTELNSDTATARRPVVQIGDRAIFATDGEVYWTDHASIGGATKSFRLGIAPPINGAGVTATAGEGNTATSNEPNKATIAPGGGLRLTDSSVLAEGVHLKIAATYTPSADIDVSQLKVRFMPVWAGNSTGEFQLSIYTGVAEPTTQVTNGITSWINIREFTTDSYTTEYFSLQDTVTLSGGTRYWIVVDSNAAYKTNFNTVTFYVAFTFSTGAASGNALRWTGAAWADNPNGRMLTFVLGGLDSTHTYDYNLTYFNDNYKSESRPSVKSDRVTPTSYLTSYVTVTTPATADGQVDFVAVYRRDIGTDGDIAEGDITSDYKYVGKVAPGSNFTDGVAPSDEKGKLQSEDHYLYDDVGEEGEEGVRTSALIPSIMVYWKDWFIFSEADKNVLYFNKRLEEDGAFGQVGKSFPDYFPLNNQQEMPVPSAIIGMRVLANDQLAIYFKDESVWVVRGMNEVLNPPSDIGRYGVLDVVGLFAPASLQSYKERHLYMSSEGVYIFNGTANPEHASNVIQSILDAIESANLDDSVIAVYGNEIWVLVDSDNDGALDRFYILDLQQPEAPWREYDYGLKLNDVVVRRTGNTFRSLFAADADSNFVVELEDGTDDNGAAIEAVVETHDIEVAGEVAIEDVALTGFYPSNPAGYDVFLIDHIGREAQTSIKPARSQDLRGHHSGCRFRSSGRMRVRIEQSSTNEDELRAIRMRYQSS